MVDVKNLVRRPAALWVSGAALLAAGAVGGAGAVGLTRPGIEVAPIRPVAIASLAQRDGGLVTVRGKVVEVYGDRFTITDGSGKTMVDIGRASETAIAVGQQLLVQGRYDDHQLRASFLVDGDGQVRPVGRMGRGPHRDGPGPGGRRGPGRAGPGGDGAPPGACDAPPPPPASSGAEMPIPK